MAEDRLSLEQLIATQDQIRPLHGTGPLDAVGVIDLILTRWPHASPSTSAIRSTYRTNVSRLFDGECWVRVGFVDITREGIFATRMIVPIAEHVSTGRYIRRLFQILGFSYASDRRASLTRSWPRSVRFNKHRIRRATSNTRVKQRPGATQASALNARVPRIAIRFSSDWMMDTSSTARVVAILHR